MKTLTFMGNSYIVESKSHHFVKYDAYSVHLHSIIKSAIKWKNYTLILFLKNSEIKILSVIKIHDYMKQDKSKGSNVFAKEEF